MTNAGQLKAKKIVHAVGPVWYGGKYHEPELLKSAYESSLLLARKANAKSIAFPSISTGVYNYPIEDAAKIALSTVIDFVKENPGIDEVRFILFSDHDFHVYQETVNELKS